MIPLRRRPAHHRAAVFLILFAGWAAATACRRTPAPSAEPFDHAYTAWAAALAKASASGEFRRSDLGETKKDLEAARSAVLAVRRESFEGFSRRERLAFLINAHNILGATESIRSGGDGRFFLPSRRVAGRRLNLPELRRWIMSAEFGDARALFALNWGRAGCPPLPPVPATGANLDSVLDEAVRRAFRDKRQFDLDSERRILTLSPLVRDYREEIERDFTTLHLFTARFAGAGEAEIMERRPPRIRFGEFDASPAP